MTRLKDRRRTVLGPLMVVVAMAWVLTACGISSDKGSNVNPNQVDPKLTKQAAIDKTIGYLKRTLASLPDGVAFSIHPQGRSLGSFPTPDTLQQCSDSDAATPENTPSQVQIRYWITGIPEGKDREYFERLMKIWKSWGWKLTDKPTSSWAPFTNAEDYGIVLVDAGGGTGALSITAGTPCIEPKNLHGAKPMPHTIKRP